VKNCEPQEKFPKERLGGPEIIRGPGRLVGHHNDSLRRGIKRPLAGLPLVADVINTIGRKEKNIMNGHSLTGRALIVFAMAAACASSVPASAASIVVLDRNLPPGMKVTGTHFEVDEGSGTARLAVDLFDDSFEGSWYSESFAVPGLVFDRVRGEVRYERDGSSVACATRKNVLWATTYPETGPCGITVRRESRTADSGSGMAATRWVVELATNEPTRSAARGY